MQKRILILGGTGMLGKPVIQQLAEDGFQVRVLSRNIEKAKTIIDGSAEIVKGDVTEMDNLKSALEGCHGVHVSVGGKVDQVSAENVSLLAKQMGIEQITYISGATVHERNRWFSMVEQKLNAEKAIRQCGVPFTIFCPTWPMEQLPRFSKGGKPSLLGEQPLPVHWFAASDLARMVTKAYQEKAAQNKRFYIYGPEAMTMKTALERYCSKFYPAVNNIRVIPLWLAKLMSLISGNEKLKFASTLMGYFNEAAETGDPSEANQILGAPETTLEAWMETVKNKGE